MLKVLKPLEVADCYTACVQQDVGQKFDSLGQTDLLSLDARRSIRSFHYDFALEPVGIVFIDGHLQSSRHEEVAK